MHFKPVFLGVLLAMSALGVSAANAAGEQPVHGNSTEPLVTPHERIESANHAATTHSAKKLEAERQAAKSHQKMVQKKNNPMHEKVQKKNSDVEHHVNNVKSSKEKQQELFPAKK